MSYATRRRARLAGAPRASRPEKAAGDRRDRARSDQRGNRMIRIANITPATAAGGRKGPDRARALLAGALLAVGLGSAACTPHTGEGAALGAATGAGLGALGGRGVLASAATGAAVGGAGALIYDKLSRQ